MVRSNQRGSMVGNLPMATPSVLPDPDPSWTNFHTLFRQILSIPAFDKINN